MIYSKYRISRKLIPAFVFLLLFSNNLLAKIDRKALVTRHIPVLSQMDSLSPFTVGNGKFAYTCDFTGLQTFPDFYKNTIPLGTQSEWGWHSIPNVKNSSLEQTYKIYNSYGRKINYAALQNSEAGQYLRANPHRLHLGRMGFKITKSNGEEIILKDVEAVNQSENIWEGTINSSFKLEGKSIDVKTACNPDIDEIAAIIKSELLGTGRISIEFEFPYGSSDWGNDPGDWDSSDKHSSEIISNKPNSISLKRILDSTVYYVHISWNGKAEFKETGKNIFTLNIQGGDEFGFCCQFDEKIENKDIHTAIETHNKSKLFWKDFWEGGGAIDLSESKDPRAKELERRIILSRYLTRVQCAGSLPPQETGLAFNSWYGKFHLEMHWWHSVHFALWSHPELLEKSMPFYKKIFTVAKRYAFNQGYDGVRWPKMVGPDGGEGPSEIGPLLIWQQPHPIYFAELLYQIRKSPELLEEYKEVVFQSAEFMASYAQYDEKNDRYVLGPPLIPAQEIYEPDSTINPGFELSYWRFGLQTAQLWRERIGLERNKKWDEIIKKLSSIPEKNGIYQNAENALNTFEDIINRNDHPTLLASYGMLNDSTIDKSTMEATLNLVMNSWNWETTWGWDFPLIAMTAARLGRPDIAINALLMDVPKNKYLLNGHNYQNERLPIYLPGNGGLLAAVAMMAAGWTGSDSIPAPGFPKDGDWIVKYEGIESFL